MDWSAIKPLTEFEARLLVKDYFEKHKFICREIDTKVLTHGKKSPDFIISRDDGLTFYCEIKTPAHILNPVTKMYHWDTTFNKIRRFIHTARKQLEDFDLEHKFPWVVIFTSNHPQLNWVNFLHSVVGVVSFCQKLIRDFRQKSIFEYTNKDLSFVDMIIWFQIGCKNNKINKIYQKNFFVNYQSKHLRQLIKIYKGLVS